MIAVKDVSSRLSPCSGRSSRERSNGESILRRTLVTALALPPILTLSRRARASGAALQVFAGGAVGQPVRAAATLAASRGIAAEVTAGSVAAWAQQARTSADLVIAGSDHQAEELRAVLSESLHEAAPRPLYRRLGVIIVPPGNPTGIEGLGALLARPTNAARILATEGDGEEGLWVQVAAREGEAASAAMRERIFRTAANAGEALRRWREETGRFDAWLTWRPSADRRLPYGEVVEIEQPFTVWRTAYAMLSRKGSEAPAAAVFLDFLLGLEGETVFARHGWTRPE